MSTTSHSLEDFRKEIDDIDVRLHDLIMERVEIVQAIAEKKGTTGVSAYQPAREASLLRGLLARAVGPLGKRAIFSIWREILGASTRMQGGFSLAVVRFEEESAAFRLALEHFGSNSDVTFYGSPNQVLEAVSAGQAAIGLLPHFHSDQQTSWWQQLARADDKSPRIVARLPFLVSETEAKGEVDAFVVALGETPATGDDHSLFVFDGAHSASRATVHDAVVAAGLTPVEHQVFAVGDDPSNRLHMLDIEGFVAGDDDRLASLTGAIDGAPMRVLRIGGYATPFSLDE